jgi:hypothetical protein
MAKYTQAEAAAKGQKHYDLVKSDKTSIQDLIQGIEEKTPDGKLKYAPEAKKLAVVRQRVLDAKMYNLKQLAKAKLMIAKIGQAKTTTQVQGYSAAAKAFVESLPLAEQTVKGLQKLVEKAQMLRAAVLEKLDQKRLVMLDKALDNAGALEKLQPKGMEHVDPRTLSFVEMVSEFTIAVSKSNMRRAKFLDALISKTMETTPNTKETKQAIAAYHKVRRTYARMQIAEALKSPFKTFGAKGMGLINSAGGAIRNKAADFKQKYEGTAPYKGGVFVVDRIKAAGGAIGAMGRKSGASSKDTMKWLSKTLNGMKDSITRLGRRSLGSASTIADSLMIAWIIAKLVEGIDAKLREKFGDDYISSFMKMALEKAGAFLRDKAIEYIKGAYDTVKNFIVEQYEKIFGSKQPEQTKYHDLVQAEKPGMDNAEVEFVRRLNQYNMMSNGKQKEAYRKDILDPWLSEKHAVSPETMKRVQFDKLPTENLSIRGALKDTGAGAGRGSSNTNNLSVTAPSSTSSVAPMETSPITANNAAPGSGTQGPVSGGTSAPMGSGLNAAAIPNDAGPDALLLQNGHILGSGP